MKKYSKAPWVHNSQPVKHHGFYIQQEFFDGSKGAFIGECGCGLQGCYEIEANARLMAASPELLEALIEVVRISDRKHDAWDKAKLAIEKAGGVL